MHHQIPPSADPTATRMAAAVSACVHCGFCLPACPTYRVLGEEMDSPRGRIVLMKEVLEGALAVDQARPYLDRCLGCLACETACPSGVRYRDLIEPMRERLVAVRSPLSRLRLRLLLRTLESPARFRLAARVGTAAAPVARWLPSALRAMLDLLPSRVPAPSTPPLVTAAVGPRRGRVALMTGCAQQVLRPAITEATLRVYAFNGFEVVVPVDQGCCGALALHVGDRARGTALAARHRGRFPADVDAIVTTAAGCGSSMKDHALPGPPVFDAAEFLDQQGLLGRPRLRRPATIAYQDACHLTHAQQVSAAPRRLLGKIDGVTLVSVTDAGLCCGSAGLYNVDQPVVASDLAERKVVSLERSGASAVVSGNIGCLTQLAASVRHRPTALDTWHTMEFLDMAYHHERERQ